MTLFVFSSIAESISLRYTLQDIEVPSPFQVVRKSTWHKQHINVFLVLCFFPFFVCAINYLYITNSSYYKVLFLF